MVDHDASSHQKDHPGRWWRPEIDKHRDKEETRFDLGVGDTMGSGKKRTRVRLNEERGFEGGRVGLGLQLYIPVCM